MKKSVIRSIRFSAEADKKVQEISKKMNRTITNAVNTIILEYEQKNG